MALRFSGDQGDEMGNVARRHPGVHSLYHHEIDDGVVVVGMFGVAEFGSQLATFAPLESLCLGEYEDGLGKRQVCPTRATEQWVGKLARVVLHKDHPEENSSQLEVPVDVCLILPDPDEDQQPPSFPDDVATGQRFLAHSAPSVGMYTKEPLGL